MMYLLAVLVPPLALLFSGKPFQAVFNGMLWIVSLVLIVLPFVVGQAGWGLSVIWAIAAVHQRRKQAYDRNLVETALRQQQRGPWSAR